MTAKARLRDYLDQCHIMQIATQGHSGLWACNLHYYADDDLNIYWVSTETTEHSQHIAENGQAAGALLVHEDTPAEDYNIGVSISGAAALLPPAQAAPIAKAYVKKFKSSPEFAKALAQGTSHFKLYRLVPDRVVLFDSKNFPKQPRQEINLTR